MTKITTDFVGTESTVVTKSRLTQILAYWGASTAGYTLWGQARSALNVRLLNTTAGVIGNEELAGSFLPKINFLNDPDAMIATALFGAGEQGVWFDPSDVANVAWRRNLLLYTEQFDRAPWNNASVTTSANVTTAPDGTLTADRLLASAGNTFHYTRQTTAPATVSGPCTCSIYVKKDTSPWIFFGVADDQLNYFNFDTGLFGATDNVCTKTFVGNGWWRLTATRTMSNQGFGSPVGLASGVGGGGGLFNANGTEAVFVWGAQIELASTATDYQRISDLNTEVIERFPDATMYQDAAGTTPVYAPSQPVGLRLDKSKGLVRGPELVTNGDFSGGTTGWSVTGGTQSVVSGALVVVPSPSGVVYSSQSFSTVVGQTYQVRGSILAGTSTFFGIRKGDGATGGANQVTLRSSVGELTGVFTATATTSFVILQANDSGSATFDNISVKLLPGNHATQSTAISRPLYGIEPAGGRRNLLTYTEDFTNAAWNAFSGTLVITPNTVTAPDGTMTADSVALANSFKLQSVDASSGSSYIFSVYLRTDTGTKNIQLREANGSGAVTVTVTTAWQRFTLSYVSTSVSNAIGIDQRTGTSPSQSGTLYIWGAQLERNTAATPYQKVVGDYEVTEAGVQTCHYCNYDGTNDGMLTNSINFTATDKVSVFAALRRQSATLDIILELSADAGANNGAFQLTQVTGPLRWQALSRGTNVAFTNAAMSAPPAFEVASSINDIGGDRVTLRVNGTQVAQSTDNQGTGNYGNYPLYLGRRAGTSFPFNGRDYGIIVTGKLATSTQIGNAENFLLNKLGSLAPVITGVPTIGVN